MDNKVKINQSNKKTLKLLDKAKNLPKKPGCYLMKNKNEEVIYVGKAKMLNRRVRSYFDNSQKNTKTEILVSHIEDFEFILTDNDVEAFVLENNLIKKFNPKYNIRLRDDKTYPYLVIDHSDFFPRIIYTRKVKRAPRRDIFGPFVQGSNISNILKILVKSLGLRDCSNNEFKSRKTPCLLYQMKQCTAPCVDYISREDYDARLLLAKDFLSGKTNSLMEFMAESMIEAAESEMFERAAMIRDDIKLLEEFISHSSQKNIELNHDQNLDIISWHVGDLEIDISIYIMRYGNLLGHKNFHFPTVDVEEAGEEVLRFMHQYYTSTHDLLPKVIVTERPDEELQIFEQALQEELDSKIKVIRPKRKYESLYRLTTDHAKESQRVRSISEESVYTGLNRLKELLGLRERPVVLECYDIAIWQGKSPTASKIVFEDGTPNKKKYRFYHLEERPEGNNDFAMMKEVLSRRLERGELPDVFVVDGGKAQVNMFIEVLKEFEKDIPVVGIAKSRVDKTSSFQSKEVERTEERLIIPGRSNPYHLKKNKSLFKILTTMRDEAHRFSRKLHHKQEKKRILTSWLDLVQGVGPKTRQQIQRANTWSIEELKEFSEEKLMQSFGVTRKIAINIKKALDMI